MKLFFCFTICYDLTYILRAVMIKYLPLSLKTCCLSFCCAFLQRILVFLGSILSVSSRKLNPSTVIFRQPGILLISSFMNVSCQSPIQSLLHEYTMTKKYLFSIYGFAFKVVYPANYTARQNFVALFIRVVIYVVSSKCSRKHVISEK